MIRFQICIFDILNTAFWHWERRAVRCDSLSNLYLWHIKYSLMQYLLLSVRVVIRFQICIFDILNTAEIKRTHVLDRCDSLSNLYLWHIKYSNGKKYFIDSLVVIRFQICIFDILNTANVEGMIERWELWFAFKFVSLTY